MPLESIVTRGEVSAVKLVVKGTLQLLSSALGVLYTGRFVTDILQWGVSNYLRTASLYETKVKSYIILVFESSSQLTGSMRPWSVLHRYFSPLLSQHNRKVK